MANPIHLDALYAAVRGGERHSRISLLTPDGAPFWDFSGHDFTSAGRGISVISLLRLSQDADFSGCTFQAKFAVSDSEFSALNLQRCLFLGDVALSNVNACSISCERGVFEGGAEFSNIVAHDLDLKRVVAKGKVLVKIREPYRIDRVLLDEAEVHESLHVDGGATYQIVAERATVKWITLRHLPPTCYIGLVECSVPAIDCQETPSVDAVTLLRCTVGRVSFRDVRIRLLRLEESSLDSVDVSTSREVQAPIGLVSCAQSEFRGPVNFENRQFGGRTSFTGSTFAQVPNFHGAQIHQNTSFDNADFAGAIASAGAERAFRSIKLAMSSHQAHEEELLFFALELQARARNEPARTVRWIYSLYGRVSGYGRSVRRPTRWLLLLVLASAPLTGFIVEMPTLWDCAFRGSTCAWSDYRAKRILELALAQSVPLVPAVKDAAVHSYKTLLPNPSLLQMIVYFCFASVQAVSSLVLVFLIGLGLRNRFRLK